MNKMRKLAFRRAVVCVLGAIFLTGCATIVADSKESLQITTEPSGAQLSVADRDGNVVWSGESPGDALLKLKKGYFSGQTFTITARMDGYQTATAELDTDICFWYVLGNLGFGGLLGYLIVDPLTGAMWDLPDTMPTIPLVPQANP